MAPQQGLPPQDREKQDKKDKKEKQDKKEKKEAVERAKAAEDAQKEMAEKLQVREAENEKLKAQLSERDTKVQLLEATEKQLATREAGVRTELKSYAKQLNSKNGEMRLLQEERLRQGKEIEAKTREISDLQAACAAERVKRKDRESQIASLTTAREGLLTALRRLKDQYSALKAHVKKLGSNGSSSTSICETGGSSDAVETAEAALETAGSKPRRSSGALVRANGALQAQRMQKIPRAHSEPQHREAIAGPSVLGKRGEPSKRKERISIGADETYFKEVRIKSYAGLDKSLKKTLWTPKAGSTLACDACSIRVPLAQGNLQLDPMKSQFMQERFLCGNCGGDTDSRSAANLLLADAPAANVSVSESREGSQSIASEAQETSNSAVANSEASGGKEDASKVGEAQL
jgi:hypothetical protein